MLDAVAEDTGPTLTIFGSVLLRTEDNGLAAVFSVDAVDDFIKAFHLFVAFGVVVDEVGLNGRLGTDAHHHDTSSFVLVALAVNPLGTAQGTLDDGLCGTGRCQQSFFSPVPVLWQVFAKMVGVDEDADDGCCRLLLAKLLGTAGGEVADAGTKGFEVWYHIGETPTGADAFLLAHILKGYAVFAVQLFPGALHHNIESGTNPTLAERCKIVGGLDTDGFKSFGILSANAPDFIYRIKLQGFFAALDIVDIAAVMEGGVFLGIVAGHLRKGLGLGDTDADGHAGAALDTFVQFFAPRLQVEVFHAFEHAEAFVYAITVELGHFLADK